MSVVRCPRCGRFLAEVLAVALTAQLRQRLRCGRCHQNALLTLTGPAVQVDSMPTVANTADLPCPPADETPS